MGKGRTYLALVGILISCSAIISPAVAAVRVAVLIEGGGAASEISALIEPRLSAIPNTQLVDRQQIAAVLREQEIGAAFGAEGVGRRLALGRLVKADVLVLLRSIDAKPPRVDVAVCETGQGLRVLSEPVPLSSKAEADADALFARIEQGLARARQPIRQIVAVPPFVCDDLTVEFNHLGNAYATLLERSLLRRPGVVVVELAEARAVGREAAIAGARALADRPQPSYLMGDYRHGGPVDAKHVTVNVKLMRGEAELSKASLVEVPPKALPEKLVAACDKLIEPAAAALAPNGDAEAEQLLRRGEQFLALGSWPEATALFEASLLVRPDAPRAHAGAVEALDRLTFSGMSAQELRTDAPRSKANRDCYRALLVHAEAYLLATHIKWQKELFLTAMFQPNLDSSTMVAAYMRVLRAKYAAGVKDETWWYVPHMTNVLQKEPDFSLAMRYDLIVQIAGVTMHGDPQRIASDVEFVNPFKDTREMRDAVKRIGRSENPTAKRAAEIMAGRLAKGFMVSRDEPLLSPNARTADDIETPPDANPEIRLVKLTFAKDQPPRGLVPAGPGRDLYWHSARRDGVDMSCLHTYTKDGMGPKVFEMYEECKPCFDGRRAWGPRAGANGPEVVIADLTTGKQTTIGVAQGLPAEAIRSFAAAPIAEGAVVAAASFGTDAPERSWVARLTVDQPAGATFEMLHEARNVVETDAVKRGDPSIGFHVDEVVALGRPAAGRSLPPLTLLRSYHQTFQLMPYERSGASLRRDPHAQKITFVRWLEASDAGGSRYAVAHDGDLYRFDAERPEGRVINRGLPTGPLAVTAKGTYLFDNKTHTLHWAKAPGEPFRRLRVDKPARLNMGTIVFRRSNVRGLLLTGNTSAGSAYQLQDADGKPIAWE